MVMLDCNFPSSRCQSVSVVLEKNEIGSRKRSLTPCCACKVLSRNERKLTEMGLKRKVRNVVRKTENIVLVSERGGPRTISHPFLSPFYFRFFCNHYLSTFNIAATLISFGLPNRFSKVVLLLFHDGHYLIPHRLFQPLRHFFVLLPFVLLFSMNWSGNISKV